MPATLTAALDLGEPHRAELPTTDYDFHRAGPDGGQAALGEELQRRRHHHVHGCRPFLTITPRWRSTGNPRYMLLPWAIRTSSR